MPLVGTSWSKALSDGVILVSVSVALLVGAELILRALLQDRIQQLLWARSDRRAYQWTPEHGKILLPNVRAAFQHDPINGGTTIHWRTNAHGFRGDELRERPPELRVIVYGDSNIQARFSSSENTFAERLEHELRALGKDVEVVNAGVIASGPDQSLSRLIDDAPRYRPQVVILNIFADNDFGDLFRNAVFYLDESGSLVREQDFAVPDPSLLKRLRERVPPLLISHLPRRAIKRAMNSLGDSHSKDGRQAETGPESLAEELFAKFLDACQEEYRAYQAREQTGPGRDHYDLDLAVFPERESSKWKIALMTAILREAHQFARSREIELLVVIQPSSSDLTTNYPLNHRKLSEYEGYRPENLTSAVEAICRVHGIPFVNLFPVLESHDPETLFFRGTDNHWNDAGQRLAAKATADFLRDRLLANEAREHPVSGSRPPPSASHVDLRDESVAAAGAGDSATTWRRHSTAASSRRERGIQSDHSRLVSPLVLTLERALQPVRSRPRDPEAPALRPLPTRDGPPTRISGGRIRGRPRRGPRHCRRAARTAGRRRSGP